MPKFVHKPNVVEAIRLTREIDISTNKGRIYAEKGDWLVTGVGDETYPISHEIFVESYSPADEEAKEYLEKQAAG